jgi:hypothetical protein
MRFVVMPIICVGLVLSGWLALSPRSHAQGQSNEPNIVLLDNCSTADPAYAPLGGCPEGQAIAFQTHQGDVSVSELFALLVSPLAPGGQIIGHPSWRTEPSYITVKANQTVMVKNRGGRVHTLTEVANFGGGFVPVLNGALIPAPECGANFVPNPNVKFVAVGRSEKLPSLATGLRKFQCCIHPWMRAAIRVN